MLVNSCQRLLILAYPLWLIAANGRAAVVNIVISWCFAEYKALCAGQYPIVEFCVLAQMQLSVTEDNLSGVLITKVM